MTMAAWWWSSRRRCASSGRGLRRRWAISGSTDSGTGPPGAMSGFPAAGRPVVRGNTGSRTAGSVVSGGGRGAAVSGVGTERKRQHRRIWSGPDEKKPAAMRPVFHGEADVACPGCLAFSADRCYAGAWPGGLRRSRCAERHGRCRSGARCAEHHGRCRNAGHRHHAGRRSGCPDADHRDAERRSPGSHHGSHRQERHGPGHHGTAGDHLHAPDHGSGTFPVPGGSAPGLR